MQTEPIYQTKFKKEAFAPDLLAQWAVSQPRANETLDYPAANPYVPKRFPKSRKMTRKEDQPIGKPVLLTGGDSAKAVSDVWFKQDDQFEQPYVYAKCKLETKDLMFPQTVESHAFLSCWQAMLEEHSRELRYTAGAAGIQFYISRYLESLGFTLFGYNESYEHFYAKVFKDVKNFEPTKEFFVTNKEQTLRSLRNWGLAEPSSRLQTHQQELMFTDYPTTSQMTKAFEALTYDKFLSLKKQWLNNLHITWLI